MKILLKLKEIINVNQTFASTYIYFLKASMRIESGMPRQKYVRDSRKLIPIDFTRSDPTSRRGITKKLKQNSRQKFKKIGLLIRLK